MGAQQALSENRHITGPSASKTALDDRPGIHVVLDRAPKPNAAAADEENRVLGIGVVLGQLLQRGDRFLPSASGFFPVGSQKIRRNGSLGRQRGDQGDDRGRDREETKP